ncbi:MAG: hypothetical protein D3908_08110 [Candidatus Electrothrix sp. AUS4]|nr:hypothetical protein [Candidatus Electrothrix sp. AUS4]
MKRDYFGQILFILIGAFASGYAGYWFGNQPENVITIEYRKDFSNSFRWSIGGGDKIKITYNDNMLKDVSAVSYIIANTSKKNLDKLKIYFEIKDKKSLPLFHIVKPPETYPMEAVTLISKKDGVYIFELEYLNRAESIWDGIAFSFYFAGDKPPELSVKTGTKGILLNEYSLKKPSFFEILVAMIKKFRYVVIFYIIFSLIGVRYQRAARKVRKDELKKTIESEVNKINGTEASEAVSRIMNSFYRVPSFKQVVKYMVAEKNT